MRPLNQHIDLDELDLWRRDPKGLSAEQKERRVEIDRHVEQCGECSQIMQAHALISTSAALGATTPCPPQDEWLKVAAGLIPEAELEVYLSHASACAPCARELKYAIQILNQEINEADLGGLRSSTAEWQKTMARKLTSLGSNPELRRISPFRSRKVYFRWALAAAAVVLLGLGLGVWRRFRPSVDALEARAFDARRLTPLRLPGAHAVALYSPARGATSESADWPELLQLRLRAETELKKDPESAYWHQVLGRTFVLQDEAKSALAEFQIANLRDPHLDRIEFDLGTAYFELGEQTGDKSDYGYAAEEFSGFLDRARRPDTSALFDRALCWERSGLTELARRDLTQAEANETDPDWKRAIQAEIESLGKTGAARDQSHSDFLKWGLHAEANSTAFSASDYEAALNSVFLPQSASVRDPRPRNFEKLAQAGWMHDDAWLAEWIQAAGARDAGSALRLAAAVNANLAGRPGDALAEARIATAAYRKTGNRPGFARSSIEEVYALQRMGRAQECLSRIRDLRIESPLRGYSYLISTLMLEEASCQEMAGAMDMSKRAIDRALASAEHEGFSGIFARAQGFLAGYYTLKGLPEQAWNADVSGLDFCHANGCPPLRQYQFISDLIDNSETLGFGRISVLLARLNTEIAQRAGNLENTSYAFEVLGQKELDSGSTGEAEAAFAEADRLLNGLDDSPTTRQFRADWAADRSELLVREGRKAEALEYLATASKEVSTAESIVIQLNYWSRRSLVELRARRYDQALESAEKAVSYADQVRQGLSTYVDRETWRVHSRKAFLALVDALYEKGRPSDALRAWISFQTAAEPKSSMESDPGSLHRPSLIFARLLDRYLVFTLDSDRYQVRVSSLPADAESIDQLARTFSLLCRDPRSSIAELQHAGSSLYSVLFQSIGLPFYSDMQVEVSGALRTLPFDALVLPDGGYLGTQGNLVFRSPIRSHSPIAKAAVFSRSSSLLILRTHDKGGSAGTIPLLYDETPDLMRRFTRARLVDGAEADRAQLLRAAQSAQIFHFSGHAVNQDGATGLLVRSDPQSSNDLLSADWLDGLTLKSIDLAVLAACSTLGTDGRGLESLDLTNAFLRAGAKNVIASLWDVDSEATRVLMLAFYDNLLEGNSPSVALHRAQALISANSKFRHPYFWSGFRLLE